MKTIALVGGNEFRPDCVPMDEQLLRLVSHLAPRVLIVPTAAARERPDVAVQNGVRHFSALGATTSGLMAISRADWEKDEYARDLDDTDLIYFTGGDPGYLLQTIRETRLLEAILQRCDAGAILAGSSAGAMVLGAYLRERSGGWTSALAVASSIAVVPHDRPSGRLDRAALRAGLPDNVVLLGIGEATGCVSREAGRWEVLGSGSVRAIGANATAEYRAGQLFTIP